MAIDPNVYALQVTLALDSAAADKQLDDVIVKFQSLEQSVSAIANSALGSIVTVTQSIAATLDETNADFNLLNDYARVFNDSNDQISKHLLSQVESQKQLIEGYKKASKHYEETNKQGVLEKKTWGEFTKSLTGFNEMLDEKNKKHDAENDKLKKETKTWGDIANAVLTVVRYFANIDKGTENFVTANYRLYGSQQELLNSTRMLSQELGITSEQAIATIKSLADAATPIEDMAKLSRSIGMAQRVTGASATTLADYTRKLRMVGQSSDMASQTIELFANRMKQFGLNTQDVNALLGKSDEVMTQFANRFGPDAIRTLTDFEASMMAMAKKAGIPVSAATQLFDKLSDPEASIRFGAGAGQIINNVEDMNVAMNKAGQKFAEVMEAQEQHIRDTGESSLALTFRMKALQESMGINATQGLMLGNRFRDLQKAAAAAGRDMNNINDILEIQKETMKQLKDESMNTLTGALIELQSKFAFLGVILQFFADCIRDTIIVLIRIIDFIIICGEKIAQFAEYVKNAIKEFIESTPVLREFAQAFYKVYKVLSQYLGPYLPTIKFLIRAVIGAFILYIGTMALVRGATFLAGGSISGLITWLTGLGRTSGSLGSIISGMFRTIAQGIVYMARTIGTALDSLLRPFARNALGVIVLAVALIAVAVAAYILSYAIERVAATMGQGGAAAIILLTVAVVGLIAALVIAGIIMVASGGAVLVAVLVLALAVFIIAVAFVIFAYAFTLAADSIIKYKEKVGLGFLIGLGIEVIAAGIAVGFGAAIMIVSGILLIIAGFFLIIGSLFLLLGAYLLRLAVNIFKEVSPLLTQLVEEISKDMPQLLYVADSILMAGTSILLGGLGMLIGAVALFIAGIIFLLAAATLTAGVAALYLATWAIKPVAGYMKEYGEKFRVAGEGFKIGADGLYYAGEWLGTAAELLEASMFKLGKVLDGLEPQFQQLTVVGGRLGMAGPILKDGAIQLNAGAAILDITLNIMDSIVSKLAASSGILVASSSMMLIGAITLHTAVSILGMATSKLVETTPSLVMAMLELGNVAREFDIEAPILKSLALTMLESGQIFYLSVDYFYLSSFKLADAAVSIDLSLALLFGAVDSIYNLGLMMQAAATELCAGVTILMECVPQLDVALSDLFKIIEKYASLSVVIIFSATLYLLTASVYRFAYALSYARDELVAFVDSIKIMVKYKADMSVIASSIRDIASALYILERIDVAKIYDNVKKSMDVAPAIMALADKLASASDKIALQSTNVGATLSKMYDDMTIKTAGITDKILTLLPSIDTISDKIAEMAEKFKSIDIGDALNKIGDQLEAYVERIEVLSDRIWVAIDTKAAEAMKIAEKNGLAEAVKSEAISTVRVMKDDNINVVTADANSPAAIVNVLTELKTIIENIKGPDEVTIANILSALMTYLPKIARKTDGLHEFSAWSK
jgi:uncharacterized membrane-anchored protein YhcB (DUF1043 family)